MLKAEGKSVGNVGASNVFGESQVQLPLRI